MSQNYDDWLSITFCRLLKKKKRHVFQNLNFERKIILRLSRARGGALCENAQIWLVNSNHLVDRVAPSCYSAGQVQCDVGALVEALE